MLEINSGPRVFFFLLEPDRKETDKEENTSTWEWELEIRKKMFGTLKRKRMCNLEGATATERNDCDIDLDRIKE